MDEKADLDAMQERADSATEGPWEVDKNNPGIVLMLSVDSAAGFIIGRSANFVAHARQDIPTLIELVKQQAEALERIKEMAGMTLLGTDDEEPGGYCQGSNPSAERAHQLGAAKAFDQASRIAKHALAHLNGEKGE